MDVSNKTMGLAVQSYSSGNRYVEPTNYQQTRFSNPDVGVLRDIAMAGYSKSSRVGAYTAVESLSDRGGRWTVYKPPGNSNTLVFSVRGTSLKRLDDIRSDLRIAAGGNWFSRDPRVRDLNRAINSAPPGMRIVITGHSLGASVARQVSGNAKVTRAEGYNSGYPAPWRRESRGNYGRYKDHLNRFDPVSIGSRFAGGRHQYYSRPGVFNVHKPGW